MAPINAFEPFVSTGKDSPAYWLLDLLWVVHATGEQTQGRYSVIEQWMPEGSGSDRPTVTLCGPPSRSPPGPTPKPRSS
jgi:hypothetical protein